jgi:hypothetical protein
MAMRKRKDSPEVFPNAVGIDVGGFSHWVAVPKAAFDEPVREFGTMTDDLNAMADWLLACGVDTGEPESTGVYWIPVYEILKAAWPDGLLVDARQLLVFATTASDDHRSCQRGKSSKAPSGKPSSDNVARIDFVAV